MSMLSAQCDELRLMAQKNWDMPYTANMMNDAADTIWQLRNDCVELREENDKLRDFLRRLMYHIENPPCESCMAEMTCMGDVSQCDDYFDLLKPEARDKFGIEVEK